MMAACRYRFHHYNKVLFVLVIAIIILQAFNMLVITRLQDQHPLFHSADTHLAFMEQYVRQVQDAHIIDTSGTYVIVPDLGQPVTKNISTKSNQGQITLCSQTTVHHLYHIVDLTTHWEGPISVSVFTYGDDAVLTIYSILYLKLCFPWVKKSVKFHLLFPISDPPTDLQSVYSMTLTCGDAAKLKDKLPSKRNYANTKHPYPHNVLRNEAIERAETPYIFVIDIDMVPSKDLQMSFGSFINRQSKIFRDKSPESQSKIAYVVPSFESKSEDIRTMTKQELLIRWDEGTIRPFYRHVCWKCQKVTDYDRWRQLLKVAFMDIGYQLTWRDPWEPFYIASKSDLPFYDGRFKQYGFNRISQVCEMHIGGFQFSVLNNAFLVHRGFKEQDAFHSDKQEENERNKVLFRTFKNELKDRYPDSSREC